MTTKQGSPGHESPGNVDHTAQDSYWRDNFSKRPYVLPDREYGWYQPAYRYGWEARAHLRNQKWDEVERDLDAGWMMRRGDSTLEWNEAKPAARDAWDRLDDTDF